MKHIYRVLEKAIFKYCDDVTAINDFKSLDVSQIRNVVRGAIVGLDLQKISNVLVFIAHSPNITVCRVKKRFAEPSAAGWADLMVKFYFNSDPNRHVCEIQLVCLATTHLLTRCNHLSDLLSQQTHHLTFRLPFPFSCLLEVEVNLERYAHTQLTCLLITDIFISSCCRSALLRRVTKAIPFSGWGTDACCHTCRLQATPTYC